MLLYCQIMIYRELRIDEIQCINLLLSFFRLLDPVGFSLEINNDGNERQE